MKYHYCFNKRIRTQQTLLQARDDWRHQRFGKIPGDDTEFVPLP